MLLAAGVQLELDAPNDPAEPALLVPASIEAEMLGVSPGDVLGVAE